MSKQTMFPAVEHEKVETNIPNMPSWRNITHGFSKCTAANALGKKVGDNSPKRFFKFLREKNV